MYIDVAATKTDKKVMCSEVARMEAQAIIQGVSILVLILRVVAML